MLRALDTAEIWERIMKNWQSLYPMFASNELALQLPKEGAEFETINDMWLTNMEVLSSANV